MSSLSKLVKMQVRQRENIKEPILIIELLNIIKSPISSDLVIGSWSVSESGSWVNTGCSLHCREGGSLQNRTRVKQTADLIKGVVYSLVLFLLLSLHLLHSVNCQRHSTLFRDGKKRCDLIGPDWFWPRTHQLIPESFCFLSVSCFHLSCSCNKHL